jgi:hypothetical protein
MMADDDFDWDGHPERDENHLSSVLARLPATLTLPDAPIGGSALAVRVWFDDTIDAIEPVMDGSLAAERESALMFQRMARSNETSKFPT